MPRFCAAFGCTNSGMKLECRKANISFHLFPLRDPERLKKWLINIKRADFKPSIYSSLCSEHFTEENFMYQRFTNRRELKNNAVPTKFIFNNKKRGKTSIGCQPSGKMWKKDETAALIALYETERCLYDPADSEYFDFGKRKLAYQRILQIMSRIRPQITVKQIKGRISYLRCKYSEELQRRKSAIESGSCTEETFEPAIWFYELLQFLHEYLKPEETNKMKPDQTENEDESLNSESRLNSYDDDYEVEINEEEKDYTDSENDKSTEHSVNNSEVNDNHSGFYNDDHHDDDVASLNINSNSKMNGNVDKEEVDVNEGNKNKKQKLNHNVNTEESNIVEHMSKSSEVSINGEAASKQNSWEREDIFGQYVATEMKALRENPVLYLQTKQAILEILTSANFELINPD